MPLDGVERRRSAILSADVVGYSRLMAEDPEGTVRRLAAYRDEIALLVDQHGGSDRRFISDNFFAVAPQNRSVCGFNGSPLAPMAVAALDPIGGRVLRRHRLTSREKRSLLTFLRSLTGTVREGVGRELERETSR